MCGCLFEFEQWHVLYMLFFRVKSETCTVRHVLNTHWARVCQVNVQIVSLNLLIFVHSSPLCYLLCAPPPNNGCHCCVDVVDTSAVRGQRLVPKNTRPLAFLLIVASHGTVLSEPASEQQAGHSIPLFSAYTRACFFTEPETHTHTHRQTWGC